MIEVNNTSTENPWNAESLRKLSLKEIMTSGPKEGLQIAAVKIREKAGKPITIEDVVNASAAFILSEAVLTTGAVLTERERLTPGMLSFLKLNATGVVVAIGAWVLAKDRTKKDHEYANRPFGLGNWPKEMCETTADFMEAVANGL